MIQPVVLNYHLAAQATTLIMTNFLNHSFNPDFGVVKSVGHAINGTRNPFRHINYARGYGHHIPHFDKAMVQLKIKQLNLCNRSRLAVVDMMRHSEI